MVSIIICAVNLNEYFSDCIKSCVTQSYSDTEILLVTESDTEDFLRCKEMERKDDRIRVIAKEVE